MAARWLQIRGDPSLRQFVFEQTRIVNELDKRIDEALTRVEILFREHGVFHIKVHFSTGQITLWLLSDPLRYRVHVKEEFLDPDLCLAYPRMPYTSEAIIPAREIPKVLAEFKWLREHDDHVYLRAASLNIVNGLVGLNFSCDGSHYLSYAEFLTHARSMYK